MVLYPHEQSLENENLLTFKSTILLNNKNISVFTSCIPIWQTLSKENSLKLFLNI